MTCCVDDLRPLVSNEPFGATIIDGLTQQLDHLDPFTIFGIREDDPGPRTLGGTTGVLVAEDDVAVGLGVQRIFRVEPNDHQVVPSH
jgi:hypothetical protein